MSKERKSNKIIQEQFIAGTKDCAIAFRAVRQARAETLQEVRGERKNDLVKFAGWIGNTTIKDPKNLVKLYLSTLTP